jgi:hypothetical protein
MLLTTMFSCAYSPAGAVLDAARGGSLLWRASLRTPPRPSTGQHKAAPDEDRGARHLRACPSAGLPRRPDRQHRRAQRACGGLEYSIGTLRYSFSLWWLSSCGGLVFAGEAAEDLFSADPVLGHVDLWWLVARLSGCELAEGTVRPGGVVVLQLLGQYLAPGGAH